MRQIADSLLHDINQRLLRCLRKVALPTALGTGLVLSGCGGVRNIAVDPSEEPEPEMIAPDSSTSTKPNRRDAAIQLPDVLLADAPARVKPDDAAVDVQVPPDSVGELVNPPTLAYAAPFPEFDAGPTTTDN